MSQLFGVMNIGTSALLVQQRAINVTGNNIANVNTPGYSRQRLTLRTTVPVDTGYGLAGFGVRATGIERAYDRFLAGQLVGASADLGRWEARRGMLERVEAVVDETDGYGLNQALSEFWTAWQNLALNPSGRTEREVTAAAGQTLADTIRRKYDDLKQVQEDIDIAVEGAVDEVNRLSAQIAELNRQIAQSELGGNPANDLRDRRALVLQELAGLAAVRSFEDANGGLVVSIGSGRVIVESGNTYELATRTDPANGRTVVLWPDIGGGWTDVTTEIAGGKIGGWVDARDSLIAGYRQRLDDLAAGLINAVNTQHQAGLDLNGDAGGEFFTGSDADDIAMSAAILADSDLIAAADAGGAALPGDPENALAIAALQSAHTMGGSATFEDAVAALVTIVGHDTRQAKSREDHQSDLRTYLENYRESVSGVSLDEEMVNLVKYQAAYNAAAKVISMADELFETLLTMVR
jgi:flagellar hook-associated protein 1 FlgK